MKVPLDKTRAEALAQLKVAQKAIEEGRNELANALEKIKTAQALIDESASILRGEHEH